MGAGGTCYSLDPAGRLLDFFVPLARKCFNSRRVLSNNYHKLINMNDMTFSSGRKIQKIFLIYAKSERRIKRGGEVVMHNFLLETGLNI